VLRVATPLPARRPVVAAHRPGRRPSAPNLLALPACRLALRSSSARDASLLAGPAPLLCSRCQPAGWPCAPLLLALPACWLALRRSSARAASLPAGPALSGTGRAAPPGSHPHRVPFTVRALAGLCAFSSRPRRPLRPTGGLEFYRSRSFHGYVSAQGAQHSCADPVPSCWTVLPGGVGPQRTSHN
jgi:hypothetical protein